jgi:hypothetical protein
VLDWVTDELMLAVRGGFGDRAVGVILTVVQGIGQPAERLIAGHRVSACSFQRWIRSPSCAGFPPATQHSYRGAFLALLAFLYALSGDQHKLTSARARWQPDWIAAGLN